MAPSYSDNHPFDSSHADLRVKYEWHLVDEDDREGERDNKEPLLEAEGHDPEDVGEEGHVEDEEVQPEGDCLSHEEPGVDPRGHSQQRVVLQIIGFRISPVSHRVWGCSQGKNKPYYRLTHCDTARSLVWGAVRLR